MILIQKRSNRNEKQAYLQLKTVAKMTKVKSKSVGIEESYNYKITNPIHKLLDIHVVVDMVLNCDADNTAHIFECTQNLIII